MPPSACRGRSWRTSCARSSTWAARPSRWTSSWPSGWRPFWSAIRRTWSTAPRSSMSDLIGRAAYEALAAHLREADLLGTTVSVLGWDQETMLPSRGAPLRAEQIAALSGLYHERRVDPRVGDWLAACE